MSCVVLFTMSSASSADSRPNLESLIFFRVLQGIGGGGLPPSEQAILADTFAPQQRGMGFAMYGWRWSSPRRSGRRWAAGSPTTLSWRWIFYINIPVGIVSLILSSIMVEDPPWLEQERRESRGVQVDWLGLALVGVGFGCLQVTLDKGQQEDWFSSPLIVVFTMATVICRLVAPSSGNGCTPTRSSTYGCSRTGTSPRARS